MEFEKALNKMQEGFRARLPEWEGYWSWDANKETVLIHLQDGEVMDIRQSERVDYTLRNILKEDWEIVPEKTKKPETTYWWESHGYKPESAPVLRRGQRGDKVKGLQKALSKHGHDLVVDGVFGPATERAVKAFQREKGLVVDGIFGPKTGAAMDGKPTEQLLKEKDMSWAADRLGVEKAAIRAVSEVESRGNGFFSNGLPAILFERHWMYRLLDRRGADAESYARRYPDIVNSSWGGYKGGAREYERLERASAIDSASAMKSCSWGAYQIMGFHWRNLGYKNVKDFVERMEKNEGEHLRAFVLFIEADEILHSAIKRLDWKAFAKRYNGPAYKKNRYDERMKEAYLRYK